MLERGTCPFEQRGTGSLLFFVCEVASQIQYLSIVVSSTKVILSP